MSNKPSCATLCDGKFERLFVVLKPFVFGSNGYALFQQVPAARAIEPRKFVKINLAISPLIKENVACMESANKK